ncbi:MAG TPA: amino acid permease [Candidatus Thermoplasmatota archaeon]|nr:amino acid permease [Candidatus Thermoplasmatota archaeon]
MGLRRELGLLDATAVTLGSVIGSGIFFVPSQVAREFPDAGAILLLWTLGGLVSLAGALSVAELAAMHPRSGGPYVFVREAFGPTAGFVAGWSYFVLGKAAIAAAVLFVFADYVSFFVPLTALGKQLLAVWALGSLTFINLLGVKQGARVQNLFTFLKVGALAVLVGGALLLAAPGALGAPPPSARPGSVSTALLLVLFAYNAWINATMLGDEVRDPERTLPRAIVAGLAGAMALYLLANVAFLRVLGPAGMAAQPLVAAATMDRVVAFGGAFTAGAVLVSAYGNSNGGTLTAARIPYAMARRGELPAWLGKLNRKDVPGPALVAHFLIAAAIMLTGTFADAATLGIFAIWSVLVLVGLAVFVLRRRAPRAARPYRVPLYPALPAAFVAGALFVVGARVVEQPLQALLAAAIMVGGLPLLWWAQRRGPAAPAPAGADS